MFGLAYCCSSCSARDHLPQLGGSRSFLARLKQARNLHGQSRAAGNDLPARRKLRRRAGERFEIDAVMFVEAMILIGEQHGDETRIDIRQAHRQAPASVGHGESAQQFSVPVENLRRRMLGGREVEGMQAREIAVPSPGKAIARGDGGQAEEDEPVPRLHFGAVIVTAP